MENELRGPLFVLEMAGLQHFSQRSRVLRSLRVVWIFLFICFFILIAFCLGDSSFFYIKEKVTSRNALRYTILHLVNIGMTLVVLTSLFQSMKSSAEEEKFFKNGDKVTKLLKIHFNGEKKKNDLKRMAWVKFAVLMLSFAAIHVIALSQMRSKDKVVACLLEMSPILFIFLVLYKFTFYVEIINNQLKAIESLFGKIFVFSPIKVISGLHHPMMKIVETTESPSRKLQAIRNIYNLIHENAELVNRSNGLSVLILLSCSVVSLAVMGYEIFLTVALQAAPVDDLPGE